MQGAAGVLVGKAAVDAYAQRLKDDMVKKVEMKVNAVERLRAFWHLLDVEQEDELKKCATYAIELSKKKGYKRAPVVSKPKEPDAKKSLSLIHI